MDDIRGKITNLTKSLTKTSSELIKTTKLTLELSTEESNLKNLYMDIGKKVHEIYAYGGSLGKFFDEKYKEITEIETRISDMREKLDLAKGSRSCPSCGKSVARAADFCPKCGYNMNSTLPQISPQIIDVAPNNVTTVQSKKCSVCGNDNAANEKFCLFCGRML